MTAVPYAHESPARRTNEAAFERAVAAAVSAAFYSAAGAVETDLPPDLDRAELVVRLEQLRQSLYDLLASVETA